MFFFFSFLLSLQNEKKTRAFSSLSLSLNLPPPPNHKLSLRRKLLRQRLRHRVHERRRRQVLVRRHFRRAVDADGQVLGHRPGLDRLDHRRLERVAESFQRVVAVELGAVREPARPREDRRHRVGRRRVALLVLAPVARDRAVRGLGLDRLAVGRHEHRRHQAERAIALRDDVGLDVAVVVLAGPDEASVRLIVE